MKLGLQLADPIPAARDTFRGRRLDLLLKQFLIEGFAVLDIAWSTAKHLNQQKMTGQERFAQGETRSPGKGETALGLVLDDVQRVPASQ
jgi:hypothetical protein